MLSIRRPCYPSLSAVVSALSVLPGPLSTRSISIWPLLAVGAVGEFWLPLLPFTWAQENRATQCPTACSHQTILVLVRLPTPPWLGFALSFQLWLWGQVAHSLCM